ncbi:hypothetical protein niasHT_023264 [Heterodera trifolii]|uniref:Uncharacterized protein n=1 Tax=Heterodera trifolii TaxID=157864 RepID=A0ABD2JDF5_9BILA
MLQFTQAIRQTKELIVCILKFEGITQNRRRNTARCADRSLSHITCDKTNKHCPTNKKCNYLPRSGAHRWWCCPSKHTSRTCPNGLRPRNQHCVLSRMNRSDGKKKKALFCKQNEMCFKAWWEIASGYGLCCKAYICHDGTKANGPCGEQCQGVCRKFQLYKKGIKINGKFVKKCCGGGKRHERTEKQRNESEEKEKDEEKWEAPFAGEEKMETK